MPITCNEESYSHFFMNNIMMFNFFNIVGAIVDGSEMKTYERNGVMSKKFIDECYF